MSQIKNHENSNKSKYLIKFCQAHPEPKLKPKLQCYKRLTINCCNSFYIEFRQNFAKETFSYDEHLKS